jgi:hypothetical protein
VEDSGNMIDTVVEIISLWVIFSYMMVAIKPFSLNPASILLNQPLKRHKSDLQSGLK